MLCHVTSYYMMIITDIEVHFSNSLSFSKSFCRTLSQSIRLRLLCHTSALTFDHSLQQRESSDSVDCD